MKKNSYKIKTACFVICSVYTSAMYSAVSSNVTVSQPGFNRMGAANGTVNGPSPAFMNDYSNTGGGSRNGAAFIIAYGNYRGSECYDAPSELTQTSSDGVATGIRIAPDIIVGLTGTASGDLTPARDANYTVITRTGTWGSTGVFDSSAADTAPNYTWCGGYAGGNTQLYFKKGHQYSSKFTGNWFVYIGPNAKAGVYPLKALLLGRGQHYPGAATTLINAGNITYRPPRVCTVKTDNTITFPAVDITDAVNAKALANKAGNFAITCDDTTNAPVTVEMQGLKGRYTDTMALTMTDGTNAPAEIRGFIGSDIPLGGECNGRLNGYTGIVYFIPNAGLEKMPFKPGSYKYNWVLCSTGAYKTGKATGSAKMVVSWD